MVRTATRYSFYKAHSFPDRAYIRSANKGAVAGGSQDNAWVRERPSFDKTPYRLG